MKENFVKSIQGHELEFIRLNNPDRYNIVINSPEYEGIIVTAKPDKDGMWSLTKPDDKPIEPFWLSEISLNIHDAIVENEEEPVDSSMSTNTGSL